MVSENDKRQLRSRMARVLRSKACFAIRFRLDNVGIQTYMYSYIADAIVDNRVHVEIGDGHHYDYHPNTITFDSLDVEPATIVHEATHAVIDATHSGKNITNGAHEASAYLAEALYDMNVDDDINVDIPHLARPLYLLARQVKAFNASHASGLFVCPQSDTLYIKAILNGARGANDVNRVDRMDGIGDGG